MTFEEAWKAFAPTSRGEDFKYWARKFWNLALELYKKEAADGQP